MGVITRGIANNVLGTGEIDATDGVNGVIPASNVNNTSFGSVTALPALSGTITTVAGDPPAPSEGQVWYNSVDGALKYYGFAGSWASGGTMSGVRSGGGSSGIQTDLITAFGATSSPQLTSQISGTETYNGTSWTSSPNVGAARYGTRGAGKTSSTSVMIGGYTGPLTYTGRTEEYDGTSWTESGDLSTGRGYSFSGGSQTAAWASGGRFGPPFGNTNVTENYDGSAWTASGNYPLPAVYNGAGSGPQTAGFAAGGIDSSVFNNSSFYDSSTWTTGPTINTARDSAVGSGDSTTALIFGGGTPTLTAESESWNGTSWSTDAPLATAKNGANGGEVGTATSALEVGGRNPTYLATTEEYSLSAANVTISES